MDSKKHKIQIVMVIYWRLDKLWMRIVSVAAVGIAAHKCLTNRNTIGNDFPSEVSTKFSFTHFRLERTVALILLLCLFALGNGYWLLAWFIVILCQPQQLRTFSDILKHTLSTVTTKGQIRINCLEEFNSGTCTIGHWHRRMVSIPMVSQLIN